MSPEETSSAGEEFATLLKPGAVVALHGPLAAGKTTFVKGLAKGLGLDDAVTSPTFGLVQEYGNPVQLIHIDCYREQKLERWLGLGIHEYFDMEATTVIEWAEIIVSLLPPDTVHLYFEHGTDPQQRRLRVGQ